RLKQFPDRIVRSHRLVIIESPGELPDVAVREPNVTARILVVSEAQIALVWDARRIAPRIDILPRRRAIGRKAYGPAVGVRRRSQLGIGVIGLKISPLRIMPTIPDTLTIEIGASEVSNIFVAIRTDCRVPDQGVVTKHAAQ